MPLPVVASYCTTFLKREMLHIYRQVSGLRRFQTFVLTKSRENEDLYPFPDVEVLPPPRINFLARFWKKYVLLLEPVFYRGEYDQLARVMADRKADLLHVYFGHTGVHLLPFLRNWKKPAVVSFHGMDIMTRDDEPGYADRLQQLLRRVPMVLARSESLAERLVAFGCDPAKIRINRTGIPMNQFPFRHRTPPQDGAWVLVQAARFIEKKGIPDTLRAFAIFRASHPRARLVLAGEGPLEAELRRQASALGPAVEFAGFLPGARLAELFDHAHVFLHPSVRTAGGDQEGVPNAMLEAMASGLPVVATLHGGIPEAVQQGKEGLLVEEHNPDRLATALLGLASHSAQYKAMSAAAAEGVRAKFEISRSVARLEEFYSELMEGGVGPGGASVAGGGRTGA
jgi:colanic acid/amylovoran biosynthesis glycosyltransferase